MIHTSSTSTPQLCSAAVPIAKPLVGRDAVDSRERTTTEALMVCASRVYQCECPHQIGRDGKTVFIAEVYLKDSNKMKQLIENWRAFETDTKLEEAMAGLTKKERDRIKRQRKSSERIRRSMGADESSYPGKEELDKLAKGMTEANPAHDKETGRFPKGGAKKGDVYSITKKGAKASGIDSKFVKKGVYSGGKNKDGTAKTHGKYGMADKCGRRRLDSTDINPEFKCGSYKERYTEHEEAEDESTGEERVSREYVAGTIRMEIDRAIKALRAELGKGNAGCSLDQVIRIVDKFENATKGKAFITKPPV